MGDNGDVNLEKEAEQPQGENQPQKDFKVAEIWIRNGSIMLDASPEFYADKLRAMGVFEYCKDIIRNFNKPQDKIIKPSGFKRFVQGIKRK
jgi:hypothetical protein